MSYDHVAERMVLASVLGGHPIAAKRFASLPIHVWHDEMHEAVASILRDRIARKVPIHPLTVAADAEATAPAPISKERARAFVLEAAGQAPPVESLSYYLERVVVCANIREAQREAIRLAQQLERAADAESLVSAVDQAVTSLQEIRGALNADVAEPPMSLQELLDSEEEPYDWLIEDLLERGDRLILTGYEGTGKSHLVAQFGLTLAAGLHPFTGRLETEKGLRVLVLDCENGPKQFRRRWGKMRERVDRKRLEYGVAPVDWSEQVRQVIRPDGIDLGNVQEYARIEHAIALTAPDVVVGGPLYKMTSLDTRDEPAAKALINGLDHLRVKYNFTLICEAHVGHAGETSGGRKLRPTGSSAFLRWPEFGYGLRAHPDAAHEEHPSLVEVVAWRGSRDERQWPTQLGHSQFELPWTPRDPAYRHRNGMDEWRSEHIRLTEGA